jgi:hypothetical protein
MQARRCTLPEIKLCRVVNATVPHHHGSNDRLWAASISISVMIHVLILIGISYEVVTFRSQQPVETPKSPPPQQIVIISPEMIIPPPDATGADSEKPEVVRTSPDQESEEAPASRRYIGERNTKATSDSAPDPEALEMPSQAGRLPEEFEQHETTESEYQDGKLISEANPSQPLPPVPDSLEDPRPVEPIPELAKGDVIPDTGEEDEAQKAIREKLIEGPNPVLEPAPKAEVLEEVKPHDEKKTREGKPEGLAEEKPKEQPKETVRPQPIDDPAFRGNQSKTKIQGSISRTGRSALDVEDTPMGRYQAEISRAVELEWQRNCVKHQDFITPGYLTVRFFVLADGSVKSVNFVGEILTGEVQKGFTLNSIRDAEIPAMPAAVKKEMDGDSLELIFNFYF